MAAEKKTKPCRIYFKTGNLTIVNIVVLSGILFLYYLSLDNIMGVLSCSTIFMSLLRYDIMIYYTECDHQKTKSRY